ncbi:START domain-containing protein [Mucilaginibacter rivuli]|uniref:START domain-containing protein n=1 Tax=Mucilaginibacter rivuli TaxID=2857527 RepID=UPI002107408F|nr:START domain-containing protein [Mucilaginibacter rivuli]
MTLLAGLFVQAQSTWKLATEKEGIKVYTRPVPNSKIKALKADCIMDGKLSQFVAVILDVAGSEKWVYHAKNVKLLKQTSPSELYYYSEVAVPWPFENRDYIAHIIVNQNAKTKIVTIDAPCLPDMVPLKESLVRIVHSTGKWLVAPLPNNKLHVTYEIEVDPAGAVPAWLINLFATKGPLETFEKLKLELPKPAYKNARFDFVTE